MNISRPVPLKILVWCWVTSVWEHRANGESCGNASTRLGGTTNSILSRSVFHSASRRSTSDSIHHSWGHSSVNVPTSLWRNAMACTKRTQPIPS